MGCSNQNNIYSTKHREHCVCDIVQSIVHAQDKVNKDTCDTSCYASIQQLNHKNSFNRHTTIPFLLYCRSSCKPFIGKGFMTKHHNHCSEKSFKEIESPFFRAKKFLRGSKCCVRLELLLPIKDKKFSQSFDKRSYCDDHIDKKITDFIATGVCLTVDLNQFIGITCLDPITPIPPK
ncbi:CotY/CotZ family spore coat protein [Virgibacillus dokdonensis]|uniref:CotY/CotZ family spore coat protein n=1 Tax=Virgibacillus dokdonensis TaxID=302167 RepID=A0ABU7VCC1_9BACI